MKDRMADVFMIEYSSLSMFFFVKTSRISNLNRSHATKSVIAQNNDKYLVESYLYTRNPSIADQMTNIFHSFKPSYPCLNFKHPLFYFHRYRIEYPLLSDSAEPGKIGVNKTLSKPRSTTQNSYC